MYAFAPLMQRHSLPLRCFPAHVGSAGTVRQSAHVARLLRRTAIQAKLVVGSPNDRFEQEADRVAEAAVHGQATNQTTAVDLNVMQPMCEDCEEERLQAKGEAGRPLGEVEESAVARNRHGGRPLSARSRRYFGSRLGSDLTPVRVHDDQDAHRSARQLGARAYTVGNDLVFAAGEYAPGTRRGDLLLAHELVHVVQQGGAERTTIRRDEDPVVFPDFPRLLLRLESDLAENVYNNAHHFYRIHTLYPDRPDLHEQVFSRFALGANALSTGFQFLGFSPEVADVLAPVTGIIYKGVNFATEGELVLDYQIQLADGVNLEGNLDLMVDPDNFSQVRGVNVGLGVVGHF